MKRFAPTMLAVFARSAGGEQLTSPDAAGDVS